MRTYIRLLRFDNYIVESFAIFIILSIIHTIASLINLTAIIPLLDVLFSTSIDVEDLKYTEKQEWIWNTKYLKDKFYFLFASLMDEYGRQEVLYSICLVILSTTIFSNFFHYIALRLVERRKSICIYNLRKAVFKKILSLSIGFFNTSRKGDIISRYTNDIQEIESSLTNSLNSFLQDPIKIIFYFWVLFAISTELTLFALLTIPVSSILVGILVKKLKSVSRKTQNQLSNLTSIMDETLTGIRIIKSFNADRYSLLKFSRENKEYSKNYRKLSFKREASSPLSEIIGVTMVLIILAYGGHMIFSKELLTASGFIGYIVIFSQVIVPIKSLFNSITNIQKSIVCGNRVFSILDKKEDAKKHSQRIQFRAIKNNLQLKNLSFSYEQRPIINNISFSLPKGRSIALVGPSGGGKSTIADIILGFYTAQKGKVLIDDIDIQDYEVNSLRKQIGLVTQEPILFNDTVAKNIAFGISNPSHKEVIKAAKIAYAHDFIMEMDKKYHTFIGDRGVKLSGGQKQRISIARAVFRNPSILILDEATSSLDSQSEKIIQQALKRLLKDRTVILIAHRLSTIKNVDEILVIKEGCIVERGNHQSLIQQEGLYKELNKIQYAN